VSPLLTLESINSSQEEMSYITGMRNIIEFQIGTSEDYEHFRVNVFTQRILCLKSIGPTLEICLSHTLSSVVKSHILVHNFIPFRQWSIICIDDDGFEVGLIPVQRRGWRTRGASTDRFLVATFDDCACFISVGGGYDCMNEQILTSNTLDSIEIRVPALNVNSVHHTWRRLYGNNNTLFSCSETDIAAYVKEQTDKTKPVKIFKKIMKREEGESFNQFKVLESIALPYYFELPHQNEQEYSLFTANHSWCSSNPLYVIIIFQNRLNIAMKNLE
ncbi:uncharacterized protein NPIL_204751, partial [Nephila pilipes]